MGKFFQSEIIYFRLEDLGIELGTIPLRVEVEVKRVDLYLLEHECESSKIIPKFHLLGFDGENSPQFTFGLKTKHPLVESLTRPDLSTFIEVKMPDPVGLGPDSRSDKFREVLIGNKREAQ